VAFAPGAASRQVGSPPPGLPDKAGKLHHAGFTATIKDAERAELIV
jgi:hypothetical protein